MARVNRKAKKILITGMILGAAAGILLTFLAANSKMHDKNDEIKTVKAKYEKEAKSLKKQLKEAKNEQKEVNLQSNEWNLLLVNSSYPLAADYSPELTAVDDEDHKVDSRIVESVNKMLQDAKTAGMNLKIISAYRSYDDQKNVFNDTMQSWLSQGYSYLDSYDETKKAVAVPGTSEHATGLALDITSESNQTLDETQAQTQEQQWLMKNCQNYGFILRYPKDKTDITQYIYEPWHYRYVGEEAAKAIMEKGITLEEYLAQIQK